MLCMIRMIYVKKIHDFHGFFIFPGNNYPHPQR
jgi:hypothetical protein